MLCRIGYFPQTGPDPDAVSAYRPLRDETKDRQREVYTVTNTTLKTFSHPNDRTDRYEP